MTETLKTGTAVQYAINSDIFGILEYVRGDWAGIRAPNGRLDEVPARLVIADPT